MSKRTRIAIELAVAAAILVWVVPRVPAVADETMGYTDTRKTLYLVDVEINKAVIARNESAAQLKIAKRDYDLAIAKRDRQRRAQFAAQIADDRDALRRERSNQEAAEQAICAAYKDLPPTAEAPPYCRN